MPVPARPGEPRHLNAEHQPHLAQPHLRNQPLEPRTTFNRSTRSALVIVDHNDRSVIPAKLNGTLDQSVLQAGRFPMSFDLLNRRLTNIDNRHSFTMPPKIFSDSPPAPRHEIPVRHHRLSPRSARCAVDGVRIWRIAIWPSVRTRPCCRSVGSVSQTGQDDPSLIA